MRPPIVGVVGFSNSGKTTVASHLIQALSSAGARVAAIKHCPHGHEGFRSGSDTDRMLGAGAEITVASSPGMTTTVRRSTEDAQLESIVADIGNAVDIVIAEGYKSSGVPKVVVVDRGGAVPRVSSVIAVVGETPEYAGVPRCPPEDLSTLVALVRKRFLAPAYSNSSSGMPT